MPFIRFHLFPGTRFFDLCFADDHWKIAQIGSVVVLLEVIALKIFAWQDPMLFGGMILGLVAGLAFRWFTRAEIYPQPLRSRFDRSDVVVRSDSERGDGE